MLWSILLLNLAVAVAKLAWGVVSGSVAMQADGFHSLFDGASNVIGLLGTALAARPADREHPYGHAKYETYASAAIGAMLALAAYNVGGTAIRELVSGIEAANVTAVSFGIMIVTICVNIGVTVYERRVGRRLGSEILVADASHTLSDVFVSLGVIGGLIAVRLGYPAADPIIALFVAVSIGYAAYKVFRQASETLSDTARIPAAEIVDTVCRVPGVLGCHSVRTRGLPTEVCVDLHVQVDGKLSVDAAHEIAEEAERAVADAFPQVIDVIAHVEPYDAYQAEKTAREIDAGLT
ncbi:MAG: cation diffusion facilitator family transporter [Coriobacteriia bacterium]|nr:cation diffusion facilitator family transporter [Coriobacteriia bacterium]